MARLVGEADLRGSLQDEAHELAAFLRSRIAEAGAASAGVALLPPAELQDVSVATLEAWLQAWLP